MDNPYALAAVLAMIALVMTLVYIPYMIICRVLRAFTRTTKRTYHCLKN